MGKFALFAFVAVSLFAKLPSADAAVANGALFYQVQGSSCLTSALALETVSVTGSSDCMANCYRNARCAAYQYFKNDSSCWLFPSITYDYFAANSVSVSSGTCLLFNRRCLNSAMYFNFTGVYQAGSYAASWQDARDWCMNARYDLLVINTATKLTYFKATVGNSNKYFVGGSGTSSSNIAWVDGTAVPVSMSTASACGTGNCASFTSSGLFNTVCSCATAYAMCGCDEWGLI